MKRLKVFLCFEKDHEIPIGELAEKERLRLSFIQPDIHNFRRGLTGFGFSQQKVKIIAVLAG